jgi:uncharacterized protein YbjT (DUF2867 family)
MKIIIFGATGMIGRGVLRECLLDDGISSLLSVGRTATGILSPKLHELEHANLSDYGPIESRLTGFDACFFCLGISSAGMKEADYERLTYGITLAAALTLSRLNPEMVFIYVSGAGTDSSEQGRVMWARLKGRTENALLRLPFKVAYMFRSGVIRPMHGAVSKISSYRLLYAVMAPFLPMLQWALPSSILTTEIVGRAMIRVAKGGYSRQILEAADIFAAGREHGDSYVSL